MLEELPNDVFHLILFYIKNIKDIYSLSLTSKQFYKICDSEELWIENYKGSIAHKYFVKERMGRKISIFTRPIINDKYTKCILFIENNHEITFDIYSFTFSRKDNTYYSTEHYLLNPGYEIHIDTYMYNIWFIVPQKEWYSNNGYLNQGKVIRVWEDVTLSRLIDRKVFGNNWSHRLYLVQLTIPEKKEYIPDFTRNIYQSKKVHF